MHQAMDWVLGNKNEKQPYCLASKNSNSSGKDKHLKIQIWNFPSLTSSNG